jgi:hypothetical protein
MFDGGRSGRSEKSLSTFQQLGYSLELRLSKQSYEVERTYPSLHAYDVKHLHRFREPPTCYHQYRFHIWRYMQWNASLEKAKLLVFSCYTNIACNERFYNYENEDSPSTMLRSAIKPFFIVDWYVIGFIVVPHSIVSWLWMHACNNGDHHRNCWLGNDTIMTHPFCSESSATR